MTSRSGCSPKARWWRKTETAFEIVKVGFEQFVANTAQQHGLVYGLVTAVMALMTGWMASIVFRKD